MLAIIDGDIICYRASASAEKDSEEIAIIRADAMVKDCVSIVGADEIKLFLTGSTNFRNDIYSEYKANRRDMARPKWLQQVREFLVTEWGARVSDGLEADDLIGIESQTNRGSVVCSIDKDLKQLPGTNYNFVTGDFEVIDERQGWVYFYRQLVLGDRGDNIPGYDGKMRAKFPKFLDLVRNQLDLAKTSEEMWSIVRKLYADEKTMIRNARLLFIWRKEGDQFVPPVQNVVEPTSSGTEMANANQSPSNDVFPVDGNLQILGENGTTIRKVKKRIKKA